MKAAQLFLMSPEGSCLEGNFVKNLKGLPVFSCRVMQRTGQVFERNLVPVIVAKKRSGLAQRYLADMVTGALFVPETGECLGGGGRRLLGVPMPRGSLKPATPKTKEHKPVAFRIVRERTERTGRK